MENKQGQGLEQQNKTEQGQVRKQQNKTEQVSAEGCVTLIGPDGKIHAAELKKNTDNSVEKKEVEKISLKNMAREIMWDLLEKGQMEAYEVFSNLDLNGLKETDDQEKLYHMLQNGHWGAFTTLKTLGDEGRSNA